MTRQFSHSRAAATGMLITSVLSVQLGATFAKRLFPIIGIREMIALRLSLAALMLVALHRPWRRRLVREQYVTILAYGVVLGVMNVLFYFALARIPLGIAVALEFTGPLAVAIVTSRHAVDFLWTMLAVCGILLLLPIANFSAPLDPLGILYALGAGICWGVYIIVGQRAGLTIPSGIVTALGMLIAACVAIPIAFVRAGPIVLTPSIFGLAILIAILSSALPYSLEMLALKRLPAKTFSIFMSLEPAIAAVLGLIFLHEYLKPLQWIAIMCVIVASVGSTAIATPKAVQV